MNPKLEEIVQRLKNLDRANLREFALVIQSVSHTGFDVGLILSDLCDFFNDMDSEDGDFREAAVDMGEPLLTGLPQHHEPPATRVLYTYWCAHCGGEKDCLTKLRTRCPDCGWKRGFRKKF